MLSQIAEILIPREASLREGMQALECGALEIALVVDAERRLIGTLTDGDVRRALLAGAPLSDPVGPFVNQQFTAAGIGTSRVEVLDLMQSRHISQIPILDAKGRLVGLHTLHEILGATPRPNWAVVMAGGRGERLRPLTDSIPKPMIKVAGRPILERIILHLVGYGIREIFLSINYMSEVIQHHFGDGGKLGCRIEYLKEKKPLGTGGALSLLPRRADHPVLVLNGDLLSQFDVPSMLTFHSEGRFKMTVGVHEYVHTVPFGVLDIDGDRITGIREKPSIASPVNSGIYVLDPDLLDRIPRATNYPITTLIEDCLERGERVGGASIEEEWMDVGRPKDLSWARGKE